MEGGEGSLCRSSPVTRVCSLNSIYEIATCFELHGTTKMGSRAESGIRKTINGEPFGKYAQTVLSEDVNCRVLRTKAK